MEARHCASELEQMIGAPVFLDSDDLTDLRELLEQVRESDVLLFFQSRSVLERPYCLLELHTAVTAGVPIVAVNVRGGNEYSHADAEHLLRVAKFIVVPDVDNNALAFCYSRCAINDPCMTAADQIRGNKLRAPAEANLFLIGR